MSLHIPSPSGPRSRGPRQGMALGVVFIILVLLFLAGMTVSYLMQGVQRQMEFADANIRVQYIAEAAMNLLTARLMSHPWNERWFRSGPDSATGRAYADGTYDYFVQDTPTRENHADFWIRASYKTCKRAFFWRVRYDPGLLNALSKGIPVNRIEMEPADTPPVGATVLDPFTAKVEAVINTRKSKKDLAETMATTLETKVRADHALLDLGGTPPPTIRAQPFQVGPIALPPISLSPIVLPALPVWTPVIGGVDPNFDNSFGNWFDVTFPDPLVKGPKKDAFKGEVKDAAQKAKTKSILEAEKKLKDAMKKANKAFDDHAKAPPPSKGKGKDDWDDDDDDDDEEDED